MIRTNLTRLFLLLACALAFAGCAPKAPVADSGADVAAMESAAAGLGAGLQRQECRRGRRYLR